VLFYVSIRNQPEDVGLLPVEEAAGAPSEPAPHSLVNTVIATLRNPYLWVVGGAFFLLDANRYVFVNWLPSHIDKYAQPEDTLRFLGSFRSAMKVCIHPLAGSAGAVLGGWATDRFFGGRRAPVISLLLGILGLFSILLTFLDPNNTLAVTSVVALIGFCTYGAHLLMVGHAAQDFGCKQGASGAAGFIDSLGYLGASVAGWSAGALIGHYNALGRPGYRITFIYAGISAMLGMFLIATLWRVKPRGTLAAGSIQEG
jgi:sugar phosphate permease